MSHFPEGRERHDDETCLAIKSSDGCHFNFLEITLVDKDAKLKGFLSYVYFVLG